MLRPDASGGASTGRKYFIAGNWKMNPDTLEEAKALAQEVRSRCSGCRQVLGEVTARHGHLRVLPLPLPRHRRRHHQGHQGVCRSPGRVYRGQVSAFPRCCARACDLLHAVSPPSARTSSDARCGAGAVSYTHLTLPTICSV
eukprot:424509-Rhodomonas_salina.2